MGCAQQDCRVPSCFGAMAISSVSAGGPGGGPVATRLRLTPLQFFTKFFEQFEQIGESWDSDGQCYILQINGGYMEKPSLTSRLSLMAWTGASLPCCGIKQLRNTGALSWKLLQSCFMELGRMPL